MRVTILALAIIVGGCATSRRHAPATPQATSASFPGGASAQGGGWATSPVGTSTPDVEVLCDGARPQIRFDDAARQRLFPKHEVVWVLSPFEGGGTCRLYGLVRRPHRGATFPDDVRLRATATFPDDGDRCRCVPTKARAHEGWFPSAISEVNP